MLDALHSRLIFGRRVRVLAAEIADRLPQGAKVLDIGCGSGDLAALIMARRPDVRVEGIDVLVRPIPRFRSRPMTASTFRSPTTISTPRS
jgi:trans-aconitate methyltransferase